MIGINKKLVRRILGALFAVILVGGVAHAVSIDVFNKTEHTVTGLDETQATYLRFDDRKDSTSRWVKRDYNLRGNMVDLQAQTVDGTLVNNSDDTVASWSTTIQVESDCFINNAWVGTVEIHQYVGTENESTQTLDLRDYDLADVELDHLYDGDLLIPLAKGDYIVYHPSETDELNVAPHEELTMGLIFYYLDDLDLSNYSTSYFYHRDFTHGASFFALVALAILWVLLLAGALVANISYKRAMREFDLRKSGLASMSSIYSVISFIDLDKDELIPVYTNARTEEVLPQGGGARRKLCDIFLQDTATPYRNAILEFIDTETLPARLEGDSISLEYVSKTYGWSKIRFFAVDRKEGQPLKRVLLTIEDTNDEKRELERFERQTSQMELENSVKSTFIAGSSNAMRPSVQAIDDLAITIAGKADDDAIRSYANEIRSRGKLLTHLIDNVIDSLGVGDNVIQAKPEEYSLSETISEACDIAETIAIKESFKVEVEVSPAIPARLVGDARRIERVLIGIFTYMTHLERTEAIRLSAYGALNGSGVHILCSIKADGSGVSEKEAREFAEFVDNMESYGTKVVDDDLRELEGVALVLMLMGSKLQMVNEPGENLELYFELEQGIVDNPPAFGGNDGDE